MRLKQFIFPGLRCTLRRSAMVSGLLGTLLFVAGCEPGSGLQVTAEQEEPHYRRGIQLERSNQNQQALEAFLKVIDKRGGDAPESHFEAGQIYLQNMHDPVAAIYHFKRHLELNSNGPQAALVRGQIERARKDFAASLPGNPLESQLERQEMLDKLETLQTENTALRAEVARLRQTLQTTATALPPPTAVARPSSTQPQAAAGVVGGMEPVRENASMVPVASTPQRQATPPVPVRSAPQAPATTSTSGRTYTVQPGDNLYQISVRAYGTGSRWEAILEANRDQLRSPKDLKAGMVLKLP